MAAALVFQTREMQGVAARLAKAFREFTKKFSIRMKTIGGAEWLLDEPSIYSVY